MGAQKATKRGDNTRRIFFTLIASVFISFSLTTCNSLAAVSPFEIKNVRIEELSENVEGSIINFDEHQIVSDATFHKLDDVVKYAITLENTSNETKTIDSISDNNTNPNIDFIYSSYSNITVNPNESFIFTVTAKYARLASSINERVQTPNVKFAIKYAGSEETDEVLLVPNTGGGVTNNSFGEVVSVNAVTIIISAALIALCIIALTKKRKRTVRLTGIAIAFIIIAVAASKVKAATVEINTINFASHYYLNDKLVVEYMIDGTSQETEIVDYGKTIESLPSIPAVTGQTTEGWKKPDGSTFNPNEIIVNDITLSAAYTPIHYSILFDGNGATSGKMEAAEYAYNEEKALPNNTFQKSSYDFVGWNTQPDGTGTAYENGQIIKNLEDSDGSTITFYAMWKSRTLTVNFYSNGLLFDDGSDINTMKIVDECKERILPTLRYSHTPNINDAGEVDGLYAADTVFNDVVTIEGAEHLHVTLKYDIEQNWDYLYIFEGEYTGDISKNMSAGQLHTFSMQDDDFLSTEFDIDGDTVTFAFFSDEMVFRQGYYAVVSGFDANNNPIGTPGGIACERVILSGSYAEPLFDADTQISTGWSLTSDAGESLLSGYQEIIDYLQNIELGETVDLYKFWRYYQVIHFNTNGGRGSMEDQTMIGGQPNILHENKFTNYGFELIGWSTDARAVTPDYLDGGEYIVPDSGGLVTLYAVWSDGYHRIEYEGNGGEGFMDFQVVLPNSMTYLDPVNYTREGYRFIGWSENADATVPDYLNNSEFYGPSVPGRTTLYAIWEAI